MTPNRLLSALVASALGLATFTARVARAQSPAMPPSRDASPAELQQLIAGLTTSSRVLVVGVHPDDEPSELLAWLSRGKHVETAYLSITRGEAAQNFTGPEGGSTLGALRVQEALAARRIDGAHQYFARAYDFGEARDAKDVFKTWNRDSIVGDVIAVIRAFRPQVIISTTPGTVTDGSGQHMALATIMADAFRMSADPRFTRPRFGGPWPVAKMYRYGPGVTIETAEYDRVLGKTYAQLGLEARAQQRTQGLASLTKDRDTRYSLELISSRVATGEPDHALFEHVDTSTARLAPMVARDDSASVRRFIELADSVRATFDPVHPDASSPALGDLASVVSRIRQRAPGCRHPSRDAVLPIDSVALSCTPDQMDADATLDRLRERAVDAFVAASGVSVTTSSDRELVAATDTATVTITVANHGTRPISLRSLSLFREVPPAGAMAVGSINLAPGTSATFTRRIAQIEIARSWWISQRDNGQQFENFPWSIDGLAHGERLVARGAVSGLIVPEDLRRWTDVIAFVDVDGKRVSTSFGPVMYRYADPKVGLQYREVSGVPDFTFRFARALEWVANGKPFDRTMRVAAESHINRPAQLGIGKLAPSGIKVDSIPKEIHLEPYQLSEVVAPLRGMLVEKVKRLPFGLWGVTANDSAYQEGFQEVEHGYLPPVRVFHSSGEWLQPVNVTVPPNLIVLYIPEGADQVRPALTQIGIQAQEVPADVLTLTNLKPVSAIVLAAHALERFPDLVAQSGHLMQWVRSGGTLVVQRSADNAALSKLLPYPVTLATLPDRVLHPNAPVTEVDPAARLLNWPNKIAPADWNGWTSGRAQLMPTTVDSHWKTVIAMGDEGQPQNPNALLYARVGKGTVVYTSLTLDDQIGGGVPGALRLFVNLISASVPH